MRQYSGQFARRSWLSLFMWGAAVVLSTFLAPAFGHDGHDHVGHEHDDHDHDDPGAAPYQFDLANRWSTTSSGSFAHQGTPVVIRWSFVPDGTPIAAAIGGESNNPSSLISFLDGTFGIGPGGSDLTLRPWFPIFNQSFERWSQLAGLTYIYEPNDDGAQVDSTAFPLGQAGVRGDVRIAGHLIDGPSGTLAYNYFPPHGDMVIDTGDMPTFAAATNNFRVFRNTIMHEHGHGIGLDHVVSSNANFLMEPMLTSAFDGPQIDDILAAHRGYGDVLEKNGGNNTIGTATALGPLAMGSPIVRGADAANTVITATMVDFLSIDDDSDVDFFSFTVLSPGTIAATLTPLGPTYLQGAQSGTQYSFDASAQSDLALELFDSTGLGSLGMANAGGLGEVETLSGIALNSAGEYYVRVSGANNAAQFYRLEIAFVPEPGTLVLAAVGMGLPAIWLLLRRSKPGTKKRGGGEELNIEECTAEGRRKEGS